MARAMQVTTVSIAGRMGDNGMPSSGNVRFDDGKDFIFGWDPIDEVFTLANYISLPGGRPCIRHVHAPKRVALLAARLVRAA